MKRKTIGFKILLIYDSRGKGIFSPSGKCLRIAASLSGRSRQKEAGEKLIRAAMYDSLTDLPNRTYLLERLSLILNKKKRYPGKHFALIFLDFDGFRKVNDTYGHSVGDIIQKMIARRLKHCLSPEDLISRIGGNEFILLLEDCGEPEDIAMFHAKNKGKGSYCFFKEEMHSRISYQWRIQNDLHKAIRNNGLYPVYQPLLSLGDFQMKGAEVLMRWKHPDRGHVSPVDFIPTAEESRFITQLTDWMPKEIINLESVSVSDSTGCPVRLGINLSSRDFLASPSILKKIQKILPPRIVPALLP